MGEKKKQRSPLTTLCYIEKDDSYLMLHRIKKKQDVKENGLASADILRRMKARRTACCAK